MRQLAKWQSAGVAVGGVEPVGGVAVGAFAVSGVAVGVVVVCGVALMLSGLALGGTSCYRSRCLTCGRSFVWELLVLVFESCGYWGCRCWTGRCRCQHSWSLAMKKWAGLCWSCLCWRYSSCLCWNSGWCQCWSCVFWGCRLWSSWRWTWCCVRIVCAVLVGAVSNFGGWIREHGVLLVLEP